MTRARRRRVAIALFVAFVVMPVAEIAVIIQVGQVIGPVWTVLLLVLDSLVGAWLVRREGRRAWDGLRTSIETGRMPARELADGVLVVLGGALMLSPGFVTDALGLVLVLPPTRPLFRRVVTAWAMRTVTVDVVGLRDAPRPGPDVVRGEVVDEG